MNILVEVHVNNDFDDSGITCAKISLDDKAIKHIFQLAKKAGKDHTLQEFNYTPDFGKSDLDFQQMVGHYWDIEKLEESFDANDKVFIPLEDVRIDIPQLNVDHHDFWWEGCFKNTDVRWSTRMIPLSSLPQELRSGSPKAAQPDLNMTAEQMNAIHEKIASGISHGLNAREIEATFNKKVTKAQLVRCMMELIERNH